ncbi:hypothetical protein Spb1_04940 [Planctopirus ephydatiae]|uniref:Uncharacterized protein n=1 Tax=Planctopirus ephydatiae TaxID=2528019 RepID=A0A518GJ67_9PLAN|nr:hypothetical protein [Planctopirus ephydatiae]QDV28631.1 hypothetical protein Spb1_04940 [Planctopirus ephydatiae]
MRRDAPLVLRCTVGEPPGCLLPPLLIVTVLWGAIIVLIIVLLVVDAAINWWVVGRPNLNEQLAVVGLFCGGVGILPALLTLSLLRRGRRVYWFDSDHGSLTCLREVRRLDNVLWVVPLDDVIGVEYHVIRYTTDNPPDYGVFVQLCTGQRVLVSEHERHGETIAEMTGCELKRMTGRFGLPCDSTDLVIGRMQPPPELVNATSSRESVTESTDGRESAAGLIEAAERSRVKECPYCTNSVPGYAEACGHCKRIFAKPGVPPGRRG